MTREAREDILSLNRLSDKKRARMTNLLSEDKEVRDAQSKKNFRRNAVGLGVSDAAAGALVGSLYKPGKGALIAAGFAGFFSSSK